MTAIRRYEREQLEEQLRRYALRLGDFVLASGRKSSYYLDVKSVSLDGAGLRLIASLLLDELDELERELSSQAVDRGELWDRVRALGGMSIGADPLVCSTIAMSHRGLRGFLVRRQPKGHGTNRYLEGPVVPGMRVVVLEDVVTTGASALEAADRGLEFGLRPVGVLGVVDRLEGGREAITGRGFAFRSLFTIQDLGIEPPVEEQLVEEPPDGTPA